MTLAALLITVQSYNVHGLPSLVVADDPEARMPEISSRLNRYDVAPVQESWTYREAREFSDGPTPQSDHPALYARLRVSAATWP